MTCSSHDDNTGKMTMNRQTGGKGRRKGAEEKLEPPGVRGGKKWGLTRGIGLLWKAVESSDVGA